MTNPTFVLVPGSWHTPEAYSTVVHNLESHGYPAVSVALPSNGAKPAHTNFDGDTQAIRSTLATLIEEEGKEVILVLHSYAGMPGGEAARDLGSTTRRESGLKGGIVRLVYLMAVAMQEGFQLPTADPLWWMKLNAEVSLGYCGPCICLIVIQEATYTVEHEDAKKVFYNDMSPEDGDEWASRLVSESAGVYTSTVTYAPWRHIPSTYVVSTADETGFVLPMLDFIIDSARAQTPSAFDVVETCQGGGHCLMISRPDWLTAVLRRAAGDSV